MNSNWSYSPETKIWVVTSVTLTFDLWPWPFAWTLPWSNVITPENFMMIRWWEHSQKGVTDGQTDRRTENTIYRAAWSQLKINRLWPWTNQFWRWSRYISMQNFRLFSPCGLQVMPGNPKFDPFHLVKIVPKLNKSSEQGHTLVSSEGGQDTSAWKISGHFLHAFSGKCPETPNLTRFTKSKWCEN